MWENEVGGLTFEVGAGPDRCFLKWAPTASGIDLSREAARLGVGAAVHPVPQVLGQGADEDGSWIVAAALPGQNANRQQVEIRAADARDGNRGGPVRNA